MTATDYALALTSAAAEAAGDKLARDLVAFDVSDRLVITDVFLVCSAANDRQVRAVVDAIERIWRDCPVVPLPEAVTHATRGEAGR